MVEAYIVIQGHVQGVFFRAFVKKEAEKRNITGWVKNEKDGSVGIIAQGAKAAVEDLIRCCKQGPPSAVIEYLEVEWRTSFQKRYATFEVEPAT